MLFHTYSLNAYVLCLVHAHIHGIIFVACICCTKKQHANISWDIPNHCSDLTPMQCFYLLFCMLFCFILFYFYFSHPSHLKHLVLIVVLEDGLPEMFSKLGIFGERGIKKKKKTSRDSSGAQKHLVQRQIAKMLTVKTQ